MSARWRVAHQEAWERTFARLWAKVMVVVVALAVAAFTISIRWRFLGPIGLPMLLPIALEFARGTVIGLLVVGFLYLVKLLRGMAGRPVEGAATSLKGHGGSGRDTESVSSVPGNPHWLIRSVIIALIGATIWHALDMKSYESSFPLGASNEALLVMSTRSAGSIEGMREVGRTILSLAGWFAEGVLSAVAGALLGLGLGFRRRSIGLGELAVASLIYSVLIATRSGLLLPASVAGVVGAFLFFLCAAGSSATVASIRDAMAISRGQKLSD